MSKYEKENPLSDIFPVEGAFVASFMRDMPDAFLKVYIFFLYLCAHDELKLNTPEQIAGAVGCSKKDVLDAAAFLSSKRLINYTLHPFTFEICSAFYAAKIENTPGNMTAYSDYFAGIRALLPDRSISPAEYDKARDWIELYGLSVEAALTLVAHCIEIKDKRISFSYIDRVALSWANDGITTLQAAEEYIMLYQAKRHDAAKLLLHLGIKRVPTADEIAMFKKWNDMGFGIDAVIAACSETTKTATPSFAYINRVLQSLASMNIFDAKAIRAYLAENSEDRRLVSLLLFELGARTRAVTNDMCSLIKQYKSFGFSEDALVSAAKLCAKNGTHSFKRYCTILLETHESGAVAVPESYFDQKPAAQAQPKQTGFHLINSRDPVQYEKLFTDIKNLEDEE